jgi:hypothetical protein
MHPDEMYRSRLRAAIASIRYWTPQIKDVATVEEIETAEYWKLAVIPKVPGACPFELILRTDRQYGVVIASETYEDLPIASFDDFLPLVEAIAAGHVVQSRWISAATGRPEAIETTITLAPGRDWKNGTGVDRVAASDGHVRRDQHFLPYRR